MADRNVCYTPIYSKVSLECSHEFCLKCVISLLKAKPDVLSCPMCRKKYNDVYISRDLLEDCQEEQIFNSPENISIDYDKMIIKQDNGLIQQLLINQYPSHCFAFYEVGILCENIEKSISICVLYNLEIEEPKIRQLIFELIRD